MNEGRVELRQLQIGYLSKNNTKTVATDINATIRQGELTCLLGANGVGKSTLLRTLSAFQPKLGGEIFIEGGSGEPVRLTTCASSTNRYSRLASAA